MFNLKLLLLVLVLVGCVEQKELQDPLEFSSENQVIDSELRVKATANLSSTSLQASLLTTDKAIDIILDSNQESVLVQLNGEVSIGADKITTYRIFINNTLLIENSENILQAKVPFKAGKYEVRMEVEDINGLVALDLLNINVYAAGTILNHPPTVDAGEDQVLTADPTGVATYKFIAYAKDIDGNMKKYNVYHNGVHVTNGGIFHPTRTVTHTLDLKIGSHEMEVVITDEEGAIARDQVKITVEKYIVPNTAPVVSAGSDITVSADASSGLANVTLKGSASDLENNIEHYSVFIDGKARYTGSHYSTLTSKLSLSPGSYTITMKARDSYGLEGKDEMKILVEKAIVDPTLPGPIDDSAKILITQGRTLSVNQASNYKTMFKNKHTNYQVIDMESELATLEDVLAQKDAVLTQKPDAVVINVGAYDLREELAGVSVEEYTKKLFEYTNSLREQGIKVAVATLIKGWWDHYSYRDRRIDFNERIRRAYRVHIDQVVDFGNDYKINAHSSVFKSRTYVDKIVYATDVPQDSMLQVFEENVLKLISPKKFQRVFEPKVGDFPIIPSNFDTSNWLHDARIPDSAAPDVVGAFRFICNPSHLAYDDPIVKPDQPGASHLHTFFGNSTTNAFSTYASLRSSGSGTCQGGPMNRSAYWVPTMMNGKGKAVLPERFTIYYKAVPGSTKLPRGLRYVFGANMKSSVNHQTPTWKCGGTKTDSFLDLDCDASDNLMGVISSPNCWDGVNLDAPDHRSHMSYKVRDRNTGKTSCPTTHPVEVPTFTLAAVYKHQGFNDYQNWYLVSDRHGGMNAKAGTTFHGDWFGAWDDKALDAWHSNCIDKLLNGSGGTLCDGSQMNRNPDFDFTIFNNLVEPPPMPMNMIMNN